MTGLLLILIVSLMLAYTIKRDIEEVLPPFVLTLMLGIYGMGILKKSHHAFSVSLAIFAVIAVICVFTVFRRLSLGEKKGSIAMAVKNHPGFILFLLTCVLMIFCYSTHFVNVWDDFHYNATFPKDCWSYGTMTSGNTSATYYKSYLPLQQLFFYWGFQSAGSFSEPMMFAYKMILIYIFLLPFFGQINKLKLSLKIPTALFTLVMPFLFMFEVQESLSMDTVMASIFAYAVINILTGEKRDFLCFYRILIAVTALTLMKSIALMFTGITLGIWLFVSVARYRKSKDKSDRYEIFAVFVSAVAAAAAYFSWKIFCDINGNSVYLSDKLAGNLEGGGGFALPDYGRETIVNILKSIFTMPANLGRFGMSLGATVLLAAVMIAVMIVRKEFDRKDFWTFLILLAGMAVYVAFLCYTYCFLFEKWEAESLSSLDRYFGTYCYVICYSVMYRYLIFLEKRTCENDGKRIIGKDITYATFCAAVLLLLVTIPYKNLKSCLVPSCYLEDRREYAQIKSEVRTEVKPIIDLNYYKGVIMTVNDSENDMYSRTLDYELIPHISRPLNMSLYSDPAERQQAIDAKINEVNPDFIYFSDHERAAEDVTRYLLPDRYYAVEGVTGLYSRRAQ